MSLQSRRLIAFVLAAAFATFTWASLSGLPVAHADDAKGANQLSDAEKQAGWELLFDGKSLKGWSNFKRPDIRPGWQIKDGTLACVDPRNAGDIVTAGQYDWFELSVDFNISKGGNSGILFHVSNDGRTTWASGPEVQLQDNGDAHDPQLCGWLYQLYKPELDPKTSKPLDATKPAGEWNTIRVTIAQAPALSSVTVNGVKYYEFVYNSADFKDRVAKSKFKSMSGFAKSDKGAIALQGDHGSVAFRNIKIRPLNK
jgi:hypothetical protein